jgi:hypothetical protein
MSTSVMAVVRDSPVLRVTPTQLEHGEQPTCMASCGVYWIRAHRHEPKGKWSWGP